jgi:serine/threonine protein kinase
MEIIALERFRLQGLLGMGAQYEVYAAVDSETGAAVVLKRPWAQSLKGGQYRSVEALSVRLIEIHRLLGATAPFISRLIGYAEPARHDRYFGDANPQEYHVLVEERARGVPLVADIRDKFRGAPIGLGQNLFALYPLVPRLTGGSVPILLQLLEVEEAFLHRDRLVLDLRPQNVYFDPWQGTITVIDIGAFVEADAARQRRQPVDLHDCLAELCKFYLAPHTPPNHANSYREPFGMGPALGFAKELERMLQSCQQLAAGPLQEASIAILERIKRRDYGGLAAFRHDIQRYFTLVDERNRQLQEFPDLVDVWRQSLAMLKDSYWRKYLFDPDADLLHYQQ